MACPGPTENTEDSIPQGRGIVEYGREWLSRYPVMLSSPLTVVQDPTKSAVTLTLPHLVLYFEPSRNQHCTLIRIRDIPNSNLKLCYELDHKILSSPSSPSHPLTRARVNKVIGPTYAGTSSSKLEYPGMSFELETSSGSGDRGDLVKSIDITPAEGDAEEKCLLHDCIILVSVGRTHCSCV